VSLYDWLLFLHVLAAFALVAGLATLGVLVLGADAPATNRALVAPGIALWNAGGIGVLVLGIGLAIDVDAYQPWDGWILGAIVLWLVASGVGGPLSRALRDPSAGIPPERRRLFFAVAAVATLLLLVDMIFKPGA
jgi:uncharacterized membrane protein